MDTKRTSKKPRSRRTAAAPEQDGRVRAIIENVRPEVDAGRFPIKRTVGEKVRVEADIFCDGHDTLTCLLLHRREAEPAWEETRMSPLGNDRWWAEFPVTELGRYQYTVTAWVDPFRSWLHELVNRRQVEDIALALEVGARLVEAAAGVAEGDDQAELRAFAERLRGAGSPEARRRLATQPELARLMERSAERHFPTTYPRELEIVVDRERARFSTWYELFPRSFGGAPGRHGTFRSCEAMLPYVAGMGFDVLYLPPIHPIGETKRKGPNNTLVAGSDDPGSPWAIGAAAGGHKSVHPELGTLDDFRRFVESAHGHGIEIALDVAFQCSPDHPYVQESPQWFRTRPDGSVQYAENPPKKYEDIYPINFESEDWEALWHELESVFEFWIEQGVRIFRVDNPHTKAFPFWEWTITQIKRDHPDIIFLSEAFARPRIMHRLAKLGFTQSYTYYAWRHTKHELTEYLTELTSESAGVREYFRPNFWPNTPDILTEFLQFGGRPAFALRLVLAATLTASYGIYGPAFELCEGRPREPGSEEYLDSEKYQLRDWDLERPDSLKDLIARVNRVRRDNEALQGDWSLRFHEIDNEEMICYSKCTDDLDNIVLVVANLDVYHSQGGWVNLPLERFGLEARHPYQMHDLLSGARFLWHGSRNFVRLDPASAPAHVFRLRRRVRSERDFEYFL